MQSAFRHTANGRIYEEIIGKFFGHSLWAT